MLRCFQIRNRPLHQAAVSYEISAVCLHVSSTLRNVKGATEQWGYCPVSAFHSLHWGAIGDRADSAVRQKLDSFLLTVTRPLPPTRKRLTTLTLADPIGFFGLSSRDLDSSWVESFESIHKKDSFIDCFAMPVGGEASTFWTSYSQATAAVFNSSPRAPPLCTFCMFLSSLQTFVLFDRKCPAKWTSQDIPPSFQFEASVYVPFKGHWSVRDVNLNWIYLQRYILSHFTSKFRLCVMTLA